MANAFFKVKAFSVVNITVVVNITFPSIGILLLFKMVLTRSQTSRRTRSSTQPLNAAPTGVHGNQTRIKRGPNVRKSKPAAQPSNPTLASRLCDLMDELPMFKRPKQVIRIIWELKDYYPKTALFISLILVVILLVYCFSIIPELFKVYDNATNVWLRLFPPDLPSVYFNEVSWPPRHRWVWREEELSNVTRRITAMSKEHDGKQVHMYLIGGPGSGKSELARQVGLRLNESLKQDRRPVDIVTIQAATVTSLISSFADSISALSKSSAEKTDGIKQLKEELDHKIGGLFAKEGDDLKTEMKLKIYYAKLCELLKQRNSRPVLIFDNVRELKWLFNYLNLEPGSQHFTTFVVIVTLEKRVSLTRLSDYVEVQDLYEGMTLNDSIKLLQLITGLDKNNEHNAKELANILERQPLAVATAAIYIESVRQGPPKRSTYSYSNYISEFNRDIKFLGMEEQLEWQESDASKYPVAMYTAALKAVNHSAQIDPVIREITCIGFTDTSPLSLSYVLDYLKTNSSHQFTEAQVRNSLRNVLFKVAGQENHQTLHTHQVIREVFRRVCKVSRYNPSCLNSAFCNLTISTNADFSNSQLLISDVFQRLVSSFERQLNFTTSSLLNVENATVTESNIVFGSEYLDILTSLCIFSSREGLKMEYVMRVSFSDTFLRFFAHNSGYWPGLIKATTNEFRLNEIVTLANLQANNDSRFDLQTILLVLSLHSGASKLQKEHFMTAINKTSTGIAQVIKKVNNDTVVLKRTKPLLLNILGAMYRGLGYPYRSKDLHELAFDFYRTNVTDNSTGEHTTSSDNDQEVFLGKASTLHKLGIIYRYLGNLAIAQSAHEWSLSLLKQLSGDHRVYISGSLLNLAVVYSRLGKYYDALRLYNRSLIMLQEIYGPSHASVGRLYTTIGTVYYRLGDFNNATQHTERGLQILEDFHGELHPHVAEALNFLGFMYRDQGHLSKAKIVLERSTSIKEKVFDPEHFILGEALNDLGVVYTRLGEGQKAKMVLQRALHIFNLTWGEGHTSVATALNSLGAAHSASRELEEAIFLHKTALNILLRMDMSANLEHLIAETRQLLGNAYMATGGLEDAKDMYQLSYLGFKKIYDSHHWRVQGVLKSLSSLGYVLNKSCETNALCFIINLNAFFAIILGERLITFEQLILT